MMMNDTSNPINAMRYIDDMARSILNDAAQNEDWPHFTYDNSIEFGESFNERTESAAAGHPFPLADDDDGIDFMHLLHDLITARIYQLCFATTLTESPGY